MIAVYCNSSLVEVQLGRLCGSGEPPPVQLLHDVRFIGLQILSGKRIMFYDQWGMAYPAAFAAVYIAAFVGSPALAVGWISRLRVLFCP